MKALVVHDSMYGNTRKVAEAIGQALGPAEVVEVVQVGEVKPEQLKGVGLLVVGCPTQRFSPTGATTTFLKSIPSNGLEGVKVAAFDTRLTVSEINKVRILAFFVGIFGYAAKPIAKRLGKKGGELVIPPEGFYVEGMEGPLVEGELVRAAEWAKEMMAAGS